MHRAVAEVFVINPDLENYSIVNHLNSNPSDNSVGNLEWTSYANNRVHANLTGRHDISGEKSHRSKLKECEVVIIIKMINLGMRNKDIAEKYEVTPSTISYIRKGKTWRHLAHSIKGLKKSDTFSKGTVSWVKDQLSRGRSDKEILTQAVTLNEGKLLKIKKIIFECNDYV